MRQYICSGCGANYDVADQRFRCDCGEVLELTTDWIFEKNKIDAGNHTIWRYRQFLPIESDDAIVSMGEGWTPLVRFSYRDLNLQLKTEYLSPTGSFKDRGASVLISLLKEIGISKFVEDSSGNAGAATAAYAARAGLRCEIFTPDYASGGKLEQIRAYGAILHRIRGTRQETARAVMKAARTEYYASHNWNPFFRQGLKTIAYEIAEQLNWQTPDAVITPLGYGGLFLSMYRGFRELLDQRVIDRIPKMLGVQPENCCPLYQAFQQGLSEPADYRQTAPTAAEGIAAAQPILGKQILKAVSACGGSVTTVSEAEIREGLVFLSRHGFFVEPTSAVVLKGIDHFLRQRILEKGQRVVVILTGNGLKAVKEISEILTGRKESTGKQNPI